MVHTGYMPYGIGGVMVPLVFLVGTLLGVLAGGTLCVHPIHSAVAADIGAEVVSPSRLDGRRVY